MPGRPIIDVLFTGGTISMVVDPETGAARPALSGQEILERIPGRLEDVARVQVDEFGKFPGPHMTPERQLALCRRVVDGLARPGVAGVVVAHGTDTLEETAYLLDLLLPGDRPVVFTGAMKTASEAAWDGPANLEAACRVAASRSAVGHGVMVVLHDAIHAAREVVKADTESFGAFVSPRTGPIGHVDGERVAFHVRPELRDRPGPVIRLEPRVDVIVAGTGADSRLLEGSVASGARGIVLQGLGRGNVPPEMLPGIRRALAAGLPVVVTSRCLTGRVGPRYGYEGGGAMLQELGCILGGDLPTAKARLRLMVLLGGGAVGEAVRRAFERG